MKNITKLTIGLMTIFLVSYTKPEPEINTDLSTKTARGNPIFTAQKDNTSLSPFAINRFAKQTVVEIVLESTLVGGKQYISIGSGVIIGKKENTYYVLTANHIANRDDGVFAYIRSEKPSERGEESPVKYVKRYPKEDEDLAVVKFASVNDYEVVELGDVSQLRNNSQVYVTGWPGDERRQGFQSDYNQAIRLNPKLYQAYKNRGNVYRNQGENEKALADYNQAIRFYNRDPETYFSRGMIHKHNRNIEKARSDFRDAAALFSTQGNQEWFQKSVHQLRQLQ
ncbi:MAG: tetratricopeptide repeat protein [Okeania sp. SIO3B5]|uniref:tetratricopeptide repeat protein n=1 Tax=Okeania sp. SIO3B5 TaxID=2607811 RepID=UPI0013FF7E3E|nr:tetratricopeptide repeat protein [Okeania sp. SIO3B5]NEO52662.1 tetratricopeptide repeat protein [Okeania sp. SIO3B5]